MKPIHKISICLCVGLTIVSCERKQKLTETPDSQPPQTTQSADAFLAVAAGEAHTVALKADGTVVAWGDNVRGQISVPAGLSVVRAVAAGSAHTVALKADGTVVAWGDNRYGQTDVPERLSDVKAIAAGAFQTVVLREDGTVTAWGGYPNSTRVPAGLSLVQAVAAGSSHCVVLKEDGTVVAWGENVLGQTKVPVGLWGVKAVAAGAQHTVALKEDGTVVAWGDNGRGQISVPTGLSGVRAVAAGKAHSVALKEDGTVVAWGDNGYGQTRVPVGLKSVKAIAAGSTHTVALKEDGTVVAWGDNRYGQCICPVSEESIEAEHAEILDRIRKGPLLQNDSIVANADQAIIPYPVYLRNSQGKTLTRQSSLPPWLSLKVASVLDTGSSGKESELFLVSLGMEKGWLRSDEIYIDSAVAVIVVDGTPLTEEPEEGAREKAALPEGTLLLIRRPSEEDRYVHLVTTLPILLSPGYSDNGALQTDGFVKRLDISCRRVDVDSAIEMKASQDPLGMKHALYDFPDSIFKATMYRLIKEKEAGQK